MRNPERIDRIRNTLRENRWDLVVCALGSGGIRHCDMLAVTEAGAELLAKFQCGAAELVMNG